MEIAKLIEIAHQAREKAYCPYSHFAVGAVLVSRAGHIYTGANVENASYGLTVCAERAAIIKAVNAGDLELEAICLAGSDKGYTYPCLFSFNSIWRNKYFEIRFCNYSRTP